MGAFVVATSGVDVMFQDDQGEADGPRLQAADEPTRAQRKRGWRLDARAELEELGDLYGLDLPAVRL